MHPGDHGEGGSAEAIAVFWIDGVYEPKSRLWRGDKWRLPDSSERLTCMALPAGRVEQSTTEEDGTYRKEEVRNSLIGNGFHLPSAMLFSYGFAMCAERGIHSVAHVG